MRLMLTRGCVEDDINNFDFEEKVILDIDDATD